jgi:hypothetical protein
MMPHFLPGQNFNVIKLATLRNWLEEPLGNKLVPRCVHRMKMNRTGRVCLKLLPYLSTWVSTVRVHG